LEVDQCHVLARWGSSHVRGAQIKTEAKPGRKRLNANCMVSLGGEIVEVRVTDRTPPLKGPGKRRRTRALTAYIDLGRGSASAQCEQDVEM